MKKLNLRNKTQGFTIIEVVLVLAIAGLIFLIVFLALPGLQRSRRDTQRKSDLGKIISQLENYASNSNGNYPGTQADLTSFAGQYLDSTNYKDPSTNNPYTYTYGTTVPTSTGIMEFSTGQQCNSTNTGFTSGNGAALMTKLESGGLYCQNA